MGGLVLGVFGHTFGLVGLISLRLVIGLLVQSCLGCRLGLVHPFGRLVHPLGLVGPLRFQCLGRLLSGVDLVIQRRRRIASGRQHLRNLAVDRVDPRNRVALGDHVHPQPRQIPEIRHLGLLQADPVFVEVRDPFLDLAELALLVLQGPVDISQCVTSADHRKNSTIG